AGPAGALPAPPRRGAVAHAHLRAGLGGPLRRRLQRPGGPRHGVAPQAGGPRPAADPHGARPRLCLRGPRGAPTMTLATRLCWFFLAALAAVLLGFSASLYTLAHAHLHRQAGERLRAALNTLVAAAEVEPGAVEWEPPGRRLDFGPGRAGGAVLWE